MKTQDRITIEKQTQKRLEKAAKGIPPWQEERGVRYGNKRKGVAKKKIALRKKDRRNGKKEIS